MSLLKFELQKHLSRFNIIFTAVMLILSLGITFAQCAKYFGEDAELIREAKTALIRDYNRTVKNMTRNTPNLPSGC